MNDLRGSRAAHGERRTLIALHCGGAGGRAFDGYRSLVGPATHLVAPDLIGYAAGAPPWPAAASASLDEAERHEPWQAITQVGRCVSEAVMQGRLNDAAEAFVDYWGRSGTWAALSPNRQAAVAARMSKVSAEFEAAFADRTLSSAYRSLTMPVTVIAGGQSPAPGRRLPARATGPGRAARPHGRPGRSVGGPAGAAVDRARSRPGGLNTS